MENTDIQFVSEKLKQLQEEFRVEILADWGPDQPDGSGEWKTGTWSIEELDKLHGALTLLAGAMGGNENFIRNLDRVKVRRADIGSHGGEALARQVTFPIKGSFSPWTAVHEFAHAWDGNHRWRYSRELEEFTGGFTNPLLSFAKKLLGFSDSGFSKPENKPGRRGRKPGCNAAGYFYGDKPSGSDWNFNRVEDFAESVAMYIGWRKKNELSPWAEARIDRYLRENGADVEHFGVDNWADYAKYFYPPGGDYTKTLRWKFVAELMKGGIKVA